MTALPPGPPPVPPQQPHIVPVPPGYAPLPQQTAPVAQPTPVVQPAPVIQPTPTFPPPAAAQPPFPPSADGAAPRRRTGSVVAISILSVALVITLAFLGWNGVRASVAEDTVEKQQTELEQRQREIEEQQELLDQKDVFGTAMNSLVDEANALSSLPYATLVDWNAYEDLAVRAWSSRWDADEVRAITVEVDEARAQLATIRDAATTEAASNASGMIHEQVLDQLSGGYASAVFAESGSKCKAEVLACVKSDEPYVVYFDASDTNLEYQNDWIRTGLTYHEFAHVLQFANPEATEVGAAAFGGDWETMADCYALTFLDGWTLDHKVWINSYSWWNVSIGYGYTCNETQRQAVRDWVSSLGFAPRTVSA